MLANPGLICLLHNLKNSIDFKDNARGREESQASLSLGVVGFFITIFIYLFSSANNINRYSEI